MDLQKLKGEYDSMYDYITRGKSRNMKNCIWKLVNKHGQTVTNGKATMTELRRFFEDLYDNKDSGIDNDDLQSFDQSLNIPKISDNLSLHCDGLLTYTECYKGLEKFENNKSPGNDELNAEFYKTLWPILGNLLVDSLNAAYTNGKL